MADQGKIILPEKYYLGNFRYLLNFVINKYAPLLADNEHQFIENFMSLSEDAQCLYVRISNRKGQFFRHQKLVYPEILDMSAAIDELNDQQFAVTLPSLEIDECYQLLSIYNKSEIMQMLKSLEYDLDKKLKKDELIMDLIESVDTAVLAEIFYHDEIITQGLHEELAMIKLFFFGHNHGDMSDFVIRDVGHARFMEIDESKLGTSFDSREEAEVTMQLSQLNKEFYLLEESVSPLSIYHWFKEIEIEYFLGFEKAERRAVKLLHKVGYHLERNKHYEEALEIYGLSSMSPLRERSIRIHNKQKAFDKSLAMAHKILNDPNDNKEYYIALDVINKLEKKLKSTTVRQKEGMTIMVDSRYRHKVELGALVYFESQGFKGYHAENSVCRNIFGLFFWDEIFDPKYNSLHQPLQRNPSDIYGKDFYKKRKVAIQQKLQSTRTKKQIYALLENSITAFNGIANPFVHWDNDMLDAMWFFLGFITPKQIKSLLSEMAIDPKNRSTGFPDLFVWKENEYALYEVKSPNDHLSEQQLFWLERFDEWGIKADIALVEWT